MFRVGNFFKLLYDDAKVGSEVLGFKVMMKELGSTEPTPMCGFPVNAVAKHAKTLAEKGFKVAVCDQVEGEPEVKGISHREVTYVIDRDNMDMEIRAAVLPPREKVAKAVKPEAVRSVSVCSDASEDVHESGAKVKESDFMKELSAIDLAGITPIMALNLLHKWKSECD